MTPAAKDPKTDQSPAPDARDEQLAAAHAKIAELEDALTTPTPAGKDHDRAPETAPYVVICAGVSYRHQDHTGHILVGQRGQVIDLMEDEAMRLLALDAIRGATKDDLAADVLRSKRMAEEAASRANGPVTNPYGGTVQGTTLYKHAMEQIRIAKASGAIPMDAPEPKDPDAK